MSFQYQPQPSRQDYLQPNGSTQPNYLSLLAASQLNSSCSSYVPPDYFTPNARLSRTLSAGQSSHNYSRQQQFTELSYISPWGRPSVYDNNIASDDYAAFGQQPPERSQIYATVSGPDVYTVSGQAPPTLPPERRSDNPSTAYPQPPPSKGKSFPVKVIVIVTIAVLSAAVASAVTLFVLKSGDSGDSGSDTTTVSTTAHEGCSTKPCQNGMMCFDFPVPVLDVDFYCICVYPYYGYRCEHEEKAENCDITSTMIGMATPFAEFLGSDKTYSCVVCPGPSCSSEVHMIAMRDPDAPDKESEEFETLVEVVSRRSHLPLTLVLSAEYEANWLVKVPDEVTVAHIFLMSDGFGLPSVRLLNSSGTELSNYRLHRSENAMKVEGTCQTEDHMFSFADAFDICFGVDKVVEELTSQYGCFASFSGRDRAISWTLDLDANNC